MSKKKDLRGDLHGLVIVNKPPELTSFGAVKAVKNIFGVKKAGHTGTLDPFATGVLPVCLNKATKIASVVSGLSKEYRSVILLGQSSDTYDRTGQVTRHEVSAFPTCEEIERAIGEFRGPILQTPPLFSAIKVEGKPLYKRARKGESYDMSLKARHVTIERFEILRYEPPELEVVIKASKGTYVRSIAHDLGEKLGTGGLLKELVRTQVGPYTVEKAYSLEQLREMVAQGRGDEAVRSVEDLMTWIPQYQVSRADFLELSQGKTRPLTEVESSAGAPGGLQLPRSGFVRLADRSGRGFVLAEAAQPEADAGWVLRPFKAYHEGAPLL